jgi:hypothetical protein
MQEHGDGRWNDWLERHIERDQYQISRWNSELEQIYKEEREEKKKEELEKKNEQT